MPTTTLLREIKETIRSTHQADTNQKLTEFYWQIGNRILRRGEYDAQTIEKLSKDLKSTFPNITGFSPRNIRFMIQFAKAYPDLAMIQQLVGQIPWGQNIVLMQKLTNQEKRLSYAQRTIEHGWSRDTLAQTIEKEST